MPVDVLPPAWREELVSSTDGARKIQTKVLHPSVTVSASVGPPRTLAVITHPYGPLGGDMDNPVCVRAAQCCAAQGVVAVRMNFRGSGKTEGRATWRAWGEQDDVRSVVKHYESLPAFKGVKPKLVLIGYSFGSVVSASLLSEYKASLLGFIAVAYPFSVVGPLTLFNTVTFQKALKDTTLPVLFIHGSKDNFSSLETVSKNLRNFSPSIALKVIDGADHFFATLPKMKV